MHARITTITGATDLDRGIAFVRDEVLPQLQLQRGYRGMTASGDRASGGMSILTLWDTKADLDASESMADKARADGREVAGGDVVVERFEQVVAEIGNPPPGPGSKLQIRRFEISPDRVEDNLAYFRSAVLPDIRSAPGFQSLRQLVDRGTGLGAVGTVWADDATLAAADAKLQGHRSNAGERGVQFGEVLRREIMFADFG
jgi:hypothetical protein